jgi:hypothetical protein
MGMIDINWEILLHELKSGKCVLCLGPDIYSLSEDNRLEHQLAQTLRSKADKLGIRVYDDGWFHYLEEHDEVATWFAIKKFYDENLPATADDFLRKLTGLPFHMIINFSPDYKLRKIYEDEGRAFNFASLLKNPTGDDEASKEPRGSAERTLIYNMVGEIEEKDSLVMTYDDLFSYMEAIFERKRMPEYVKRMIQQATYFIFLGMPLDKWYFHLFMRLLNQHRNKRKTKRYSASSWFNDDNATFCEEQYTITFVREGIAPFVDQLVSHYKEATGGDGEDQLSDFDRWRERLKVPDTKVVKKVLQEMKAKAEGDSDVSTELILVESNWSFFENNTFETEKSEMAVRTKIINDILGLINSLESSAVKT